MNDNDGSFIIPKEVVYGTFRCGACGSAQIQVVVAWAVSVSLECTVCSNKAVILLQEEEKTDGGS